MLSEKLVIAGFDPARFDATHQELNDIAAGRRDKLVREGDFLRSKVAWKVASLEQVLRYRLVSLTNSTIVQWNIDLFLGSIVCARSLAETAALVRHAERQIVANVGAKSIAALDQTVMKYLFATRDAEWLAERPDDQAVNILTMINSAFPEIPQFRSHYDSLCEYAHPNSNGHRNFFSSIDYETGTVSFVPDKRRSHSLAAIAPVLSIVGLAGRSLASMGRLTAEVADLQEQAERAGAC